MDSCNLRLLIELLLGVEVLLLSAICVELALDVVFETTDIDLVDVVVLRDAELRIISTG